MDKSILEDFKLKSYEIIKETETFDFPFLSNAEKKYQIVQEKKKYVDKCFNVILLTYTMKTFWPEAIWDAAKEYASGEFVSLPEKIKLNGFYLQELMHEYAKQVSEYLTEQLLTMEE